MKCKMYLFVAVLANGRHLGFLIGRSYRVDLITIEMSHAKFGDCITICTIHPKMHTICSTMLQHCPNVISLMEFVIVE